ncbi:MAG: response regulator [Candidatus Nitrosopolaris wilkensis]|nr:MAG: response regulator [Candidatus Nitrosopolaris wilkensis]
MKKKEGDAENRSKGRLLVNKTSMRILVVDDEPDINTTLEKALEQNGFKVDSYECPLMALENFTPYYYDLAILHIKMPEMNGFSFYREIKKLDKNLRICFLTAGEMYYGAYSDIFSSLPANYFIRKPIGNEDLIKRIDKIINNVTIQLGSK